MSAHRDSENSSSSLSAPNSPFIKQEQKVSDFLLDNAEKADALERKMEFKLEDQEVFGLGEYDNQYDQDNKMRQGTKSEAPRQKTSKSAHPYKIIKSSRRVSSSQQTASMSAVMTPEGGIDTATLLPMTKEFLILHEISQKMLSDKVLGCHSAHLSRVLMEPKPWNEMSQGRKLVNRIYDWMKLPLEMKLAIKDNTKSSQEYCRSIGFQPPLEKAKNQKACKRYEFTHEQRVKMMEIFEDCRGIPSIKEVEKCAEDLGLPLIKVKNFMKNANSRDLMLVTLG